MKRIPILLILAACGGESATPSVTVKSATPDRLTMSDDSANDLTITVSYDDGDGDLGGGSAEVHDCRADELVTTLAIPAIAPPDVVKDKSPISGELDLYVTDVGAATAAALPSTCSDLGIAPLADMTTVFCVILIDAAGHHSTGDCTKPVMLFP